MRTRKQQLNYEAVQRYRAKKIAEDPDYYNKRSKRYREENRDTVNSNSLKCYHKNKHDSSIVTYSPEYKLWKEAKYRSIKKSIEFNIELSDIKIPKICPALGIPIITKSEVGDGENVKANSPSLDRVDNSLGYIKGNVQVISSRANRLKSDGTIDDFKRFIKYIRKYSKS